MKNLVELTSGELDIICGGQGIDWSEIGIGSLFGVAFRPIPLLIVAISYGTDGISRCIGGILGSIVTLGLDFLAVYGINKWINYLTSRSKKSKETDKN